LLRDWPADEIIVVNDGPTEREYREPESLGTQIRVIQLRYVRRATSVLPGLVTKAGSLEYSEFAARIEDKLLIYKASTALWRGCKDHGSSGALHGELYSSIQLIVVVLNHVGLCASGNYYKCVWVSSRFMHSRRGNRFESRPSSAFRTGAFCRTAIERNLDVIPIAMRWTR
jgi:hypothetical protein